MNPKPSPSVVLKPLDFRPPPNGDAPGQSETAREWYRWVERGFMLVCSAVNTLAVRFDRLDARFTELNDNVLQALGAPRPRQRSRADSWEEITGVQSLEGAKDAARDYRQRLADERARAERAEQEASVARAANQAELGAARAEVRHLIRVIKGIVVTIIVLALGGGAVVAQRELNKPAPAAPGR